MKRILFVCHGNICRSPMAEYMMKHLLRERGLSDDFEVVSAATSTEELDDPWYTRDFDSTYRDISLALPALIEHFKV